MPAARPLWIVLRLCAVAVLLAPGTISAADDARDAKQAQSKPTQYAGEDWPVFLGLRETGVSGETGLLETWPAAGPPILWEKRVGTGYSAPSVRGQQLVLHHRLRGEEIVECFDAATGDSLWKHAYSSEFSDPYGYNNGPRCSPLLTADRCYTFGAEGKLLCLELASGRPVWERNTLQDWTVPENFFGVGCTPVLEGKLLIVLVGGAPNSAVVAFNADTGETVWESVGKETWEGARTEFWTSSTYEWTDEDKLVSYSSPIVATIHGKRHILCLLRHGLVSLDPRDGSLNFKYWFRSRTHDSVNAARPVVVGDKVFLSAAYNTGAALLQVQPDGKNFKVVWRNPRGMSTHWSTAIHHDGYLYGFSGRHEQEGMLQCVELETGELKWETSGYAGELSELAQDRTTGQIVNRGTGKPVPWPFYGRGSKILADGKFIVLGERGTLALVKVDPMKFEELARTSYKQITAPSWTAPVLSRKRLYLRDEDSLICLDLAPTSSNSGTAE